MTARVRRRARRGKSNDLSDRLAAFRHYRSPNLGAIATDLLGEDRVRKVVALALLLSRKGHRGAAQAP